MEHTGELEFLQVAGHEFGHVVRRNGIILVKPDWMSENYWYTYEANRCGKYYGIKDDNHKPVLYGQDNPDTPKWNPDEIMEGGCAGGACIL